MPPNEKLCYFMPKSFFNKPASALGAFTTTIFTALASLPWAKKRLSVLSLCQRQIGVTISFFLPGFPCLAQLVQADITAVAAGGYLPLRQGLQEAAPLFLHVGTVLKETAIQVGAELS